ncbi:MAG: NUDIX domain-containing protein [Candidatus Pacebacteria bacterium]|jgi:8-oxo-dGTP pyrophosphatase MutT (NUDIX family)|nr:NUDIX domain-containing protein [Candidatus Paceibacterota bacterium]MBT4652441.1 NUDIX domain-containing protein [Candidatus Paceibacterota bacterium]MBT6756268.1 NUDIX domain-containing protein [Candidatus Paceibacterota bacterium]MBT6921559.1 NUDIX domain-containing protein [Candidatus Paceibacterota bacterium]
MKESSKFPPKACLTAAGFLVVDDKVLLIKHKKLGIWLAPGGHIDDGEMPHQAAEREFWEETNVKVEAQSTQSLFPGTDNSGYYPTPFAVNLHWINKDFYKQRIESDTPDKKVVSSIWKLGCEKHLVFTYLVKPTGSIEFKQNVEETDGIAWFSKEDLKDLETIPEVRYEASWALENTAKILEKVK